MPPNKVLIRRIGSLDVIEGVEYSDHESTEHRGISNVGIVESICSELYFSRDHVLWMKHVGRTAHEIQKASHQSAMFLAEIEAKPGDKVIYRRVNNVNEDEVYGDDMLVIPHDDLIARINPDGSLYPLAGNVIIEDTKSSITTVIAAGKPLMGYFDHAGYRDYDVELAGKTVAVNHKQAAPVADETLSEYGKLAYIKRRHILLIVE